MKDSDIRGVVLEKFYDGRNKDKYFPKEEDFPGIEMSAIFRVCDQLHEHGLLKTWKTVGSPVAQGFGMISANGVDVMEGNTKPPLSISITNNHQNISVGNITQASSITIGNNNSVSVESSLKEIIEALKENSSASEEEKQSALSLLKNFIAHPLVSSMAGAGLSLFG